MSLDTLSGKVDEFRQRKNNHNQEADLISLDQDKVNQLIAGSSGVDDGIISLFSDIQTDIQTEQSRLEIEAEELDSIRQSLVNEISEQISVNDAVKTKADAISVKKYTDGIDKVALKASEYISELQQMLDELEANGLSSSDSMSMVADTDSSIFGYSDINDLVHDTAVLHNFNDGNVSNVLDGFKQIHGEHSIEDDLQAVNPNYDEYDYNSPWSNNCQRCVSAYEARRRGYDVEALPLPSDHDPLMIMNHPKGWPTVYKNGRLVDCSAITGELAGNNVKNQVREWGPGARAIVRVRWTLGGGHVFIAENVEGTIRFIDPQNNNHDANDYFTSAKGTDMFCMRIDNLSFTGRIRRCCKAR